jgi:hypothetical protein
LHKCVTVTNKCVDRLRLVQDENRAVLQSFKGDFDLKAQSIFDEMLQFKSLIDSMQSELQEKAKDHATGLQKVSLVFYSNHDFRLFLILHIYTELVHN